MAATLLLADDSVTIQRVIELTFADEDVTVIAVGDGDAAIARVEAQPPDIVLADVGMPGKNGYEVASYIKHSPRLAHIPVILLTGAFEPVDQRKANEAGCDGVLAKPFEPQLVISRVRELLGRAPGTLAVPQAPVPGEAPTVQPPSRDPVATVSDAAPPVPLEDFFDELDAAFARLPGARADPVTIADGLDLGELRRPPVEPPDRPAVNADDSWDLAPQPGRETDLPPVMDAPRDDAERVAPPRETPPARDAAAARRAPTPPTQAMPALADAFATLLAAEQPGAAPADTGGWAPPARVDDELVERIAALVLARLSDQVVRETAADIVSAIAERLVREEIDRIKAAVK